MYRHSEHEENQNNMPTMAIEGFSPSHAKENAPPLSERLSEASKQRQAIQAKLESLNNDLRYSGFGQLHVCLCDSNTINSLSEVIRDMLAQISKQKRRNRQLQQQSNQQRNLQRQKSREKHQIASERDAVARQKDHLQEKYNRLLREHKEKEEKWNKEKETFNKQRKISNQRQISLISSARLAEEKVRACEQKIKKMMQKNEKVEFRNASFEVYTPLSRGDRSMLQREYEQGVANSIEQHTRGLKEENRLLRETMKEVFMRLQHVAQRIDPEQVRDTHRAEIIDLPNTSTRKGYPDLLRKFLTAIEQRTSQLISPPVTSTGNTSCDAAELAQTVSRLKSFYSSWQAVNESRKAIVPGILKMAAERSRLAKLAELAEFEEGEHERELRGEQDVENYVMEKMEYFNREIKRVNRWNSQMESLQAEIYE